ncbi:MAG: DUF3737 family protein [Ruminococcaceae bacterium]|nr:DUF3737 family protein [Oscillospiraceae bacterium]
MKTIRNSVFDTERALYGEKEINVVGCTFDGPADGESALKECSNVFIDNCCFRLRYPFWHDDGLTISNSEMTDTCRAPIWYSKHINVCNSEIHGVKALRECNDVRLENCDIISAELGWSVNTISVSNCFAEGEYMFLRSNNLNFDNFEMKGKYSFQYIENAGFKNCTFDTKDAFWHAKNIHVKNCTVKGEYLAWYCENATFENCVIIGTQPFCYCKNLSLIDCEMHEADFSFEKSDVEAYVNSHIISIKNPRSGKISVPSVGEIIMDDENAKGKIIVG